MGMVPKMLGMKDKDEAILIKNKSLVEAFPEVKDYANDLSALINATRERFGVISLDIRNGSMPSKTTEALVGAFFGHISEKIEGSNPSCLKLCKTVSTEEFHFLESIVSSEEHGGITVPRLRDSESLTYTCNLYDEIDIDLIWQLFLNDTKKCRFEKKVEKELTKKECFTLVFLIDVKALFPNYCPQTNNQEEKADLHAIHVALKSRPMKRLRDFQKRKSETAPTILGQHTVREKLDMMFVPQSISDLPQDPTAEQQEEDNCGFLE